MVCIIVKVVVAYDFNKEKNVPVFFKQCQSQYEIEYRIEPATVIYEVIDGKEYWSIPLKEKKWQ